MSERHEAVDDQNLAQAEREQACADFHAECTDLMHDVEARLEQPEQASLPPETAAWATEVFADLEPRDAMLLACARFEADERQFDPAYDIATDDPDVLGADIEMLMAQQALQGRNQTTTGQIADSVPAKVPAEVGEEAASLTQERLLVADTNKLSSAQLALSPQRDKDVSDAEKAEGKTEELRGLQAAFDQLCADGVGTAEALRQVIAQAENPETKPHLHAILSRVALLQAALPDKPEVVSRLLNTTGLNLSAATVAGSFVDFITAAETDEERTDAERVVLRNIIKREERFAKTGSDVQHVLGQTLTTPDGQTMPVHPEDKPYQFRDHVQGFADLNGNQHLRAVTIHGEQVTLDITSWPAADVGRASELLQLWAMTEDEGRSGYLTSLTKLN